MKLPCLNPSSVFYLTQGKIQSSSVARRTPHDPACDTSLTSFPSPHLAYSCPATAALRHARHPPTSAPLHSESPLPVVFFPTCSHGWLFNCSYGPLVYRSLLPQVYKRLSALLGCSQSPYFALFFFIALGITWNRCVFVSLPLRKA